MVVRAKKMIDVGTVRLCGCVREWVSVWVGEEGIRDHGDADVWVGTAQATHTDIGSRVRHVEQTA